MRRLENKLFNATTSEKVIAGIFEKYGIAFNYERQVLVEDDIGSKVKARLFYPDFYLKDYGIIVEFVGLPDDPGYMKMVERKKRIYEDMGLKIVYADLYEMWEKKNLGNGYRVKEDFENILLGKIQNEIERGYSSKLEMTNLYTSGASNYNYSDLGHGF